MDNQLMYICPRGFEDVCCGELQDTCGLTASAAAPLPGYGIILVSHASSNVTPYDMLHRSARLLGIESASAYLGLLRLPRARLEDDGTTLQQKLDYIKQLVLNAESQLQWQRALELWHYCRPDLPCHYMPVYPVAPGYVWPIGGRHTAQQQQEQQSQVQLQEAQQEQQPEPSGISSSQQAGKQQQQRQQQQQQEEQQQQPKVRFRVTLERLEYKHKNLKREDFAGAVGYACGDHLEQYMRLSINLKKFDLEVLAMLMPDDSQPEQLHLHLGVALPLQLLQHRPQLLRLHQQPRRNEAAALAAALGQQTTTATGAPTQTPEVGEPAAAGASGAAAGAAAGAAGAAAAGAAGPPLDPLTLVQPLELRNRVKFGRTSLRPTIAFCLSRLAAPQPGELLVDPFCGVGTIPIEAALGFPAAFFLGGDRDSEQLGGAGAANVAAAEATRCSLREQQQQQQQQEGASSMGPGPAAAASAAGAAVGEVSAKRPRHNGACAGSSGAVAGSSRASALPLDLCVWSVDKLPLRDACVDRMISDLPWGMRELNFKQCQQLYPRIVRELGRVLKPGGLAFLVTQERKLMLRNLGERFCQLEMLQERSIVIGFKVWLYVLRRRTPDEQTPAGGAAGTAEGVAAGGAGGA